MAKVDVVGVTKHPKERIVEAVQKAVETRLSELKASIEKIGQSLKDFEAKHKMSTGIFYKKYPSRELEENLDFVEWGACREILDDLLEEKGLLEEITD